MGIINETSEKSLSRTITDIVFPCMIFSATVRSLEQIRWAEAGEAALISAMVFASTWLLGRLVFGKYPSERKCALALGCMISNAAFIGFPLVSGTWGDVGIFYTTIFMTVSRVFLWTVGVALFPAAREEHQSPVRAVLLNPNSIAMYLALIYHYLLPFSLPVFLLEATAEVGDMSTVFCMVMVGSLLHGIKIRELCQTDAVRFCTARLIGFPVVLFFLLRSLNADGVITAVMTLLVSTPAPTMGSVLAARYGGDKKFASELVLTSTILSLGTIPLVALLYS